MYLVSCEEKGTTNIAERFCNNKEEARTFILEQSYVEEVAEQAIKSGIFESTFDLVTVKNLARRHAKGSRSRADMLAIQSSLLATLIANYPKPTHSDALEDETPESISQRTLSRYLADWEATGMVDRLEHGYVALSKLGVQTFIVQAQKDSLHSPC